VLQFLKETVPKEAQKAQKSLARFDDALFVMGIEARMKTGRRVVLRGPDMVAVAQEWRKVAKQYQSMLRNPLVMLLQTPPIPVPAESTLLSITFLISSSLGSSTSMTLLSLSNNPRNS